MRLFLHKSWILGLLLSLCTVPLKAEFDVYLLDVPDYQWYGGCTGTGSGIIMGYWDRNGFPDFYTGPTAGGFAPLTSSELTNYGIRALWTSKAGIDGRPTNQFGHYDDYWGPYDIYDSHTGYEGTDRDPYVVAGRPEHTPDCIGDFIGLSQKKWTNLNNECDGNINSYAVVYWDSSGNKRTNYNPPPQGTNMVRDVPWGWLEWTKWRGYQANVFSQLTDFNTTVPVGKGFTFGDLTNEINAGYPVLLYQQNFNIYSRYLFNPDPMPRANPAIHALVAFGYIVGDDGSQWVHFRSVTAFPYGDNIWAWDASDWEPGASLPVRGVCGYRPLPKVTSIVRTNQTVRITWHGPAGKLYSSATGTATNLHYYVVERSPDINPANFVPVTTPSTEHQATVPEGPGDAVFYRVRLLEAL